MIKLKLCIDRLDGFVDGYNLRIGWDGGIKMSKNIFEIANSIKHNPLYSDSWDEIKNKYIKDPVKNEKHMREIIYKRNELIKQVKKDFCSKCDFNISGSKSLTSDVDVTVFNQNKSNNLFAFNEIKTMIKILRCLFNNKEILLTLDINFYGHSFFFGKNLSGVCNKYYNKQEFYIPLDIEMEMRYRYCEAFSLLKVKKHYKETDLKLKKKWGLNFDLCKKIMNNFSEISKSNDKNDLFEYVNIKNDTTNNTFMYLNQLKYIEKLSHNKNNLSKKKLRYILICEISHSAIYAEESYFSYGAFMHVVYGDQMKRDISNLPKIIYIQSMLDNFGDIIKVYNKTKTKLELFSQGSKYIVRVYSAIVELNYKSYNNTLQIFKVIRKLFKENPKDPDIKIYIKKSKLTLDKIKDLVYSVYNNYRSQIATIGYKN